jgi:uncharacterized membrane protein
MRFLTLLQIFCILGSGMVAGTFLAFSSFIMAALAKLPPSGGIMAMQQINITVINPVFMLTLFGTGLAALYLVFVSYQQGPMMLGAGALFYVLGVLGVTMILNVPLNNQLAALDPMANSAATMWAEYISSWTFWNTVRCVAAALSCLLMLLDFGH